MMEKNQNIRIVTKERSDAIKIYDKNLISKLPNHYKHIHIDAEKTNFKLPNFLIRIFEAIKLSKVINKKDKRFFLLSQR